jgi:predicted transcriptional regulator
MDLPDNANVAIPSALAAEVQAVADAEHRPMSDVLRDALERYLEPRRWRQHADAEQAAGRDLGLPDDDAPLSAEYRQTLREEIAQGLQSLREGRCTDGEAFFAQIDAEFNTQP